MEKKIQAMPTPPRKEAVAVETLIFLDHIAHARPYRSTISTADYATAMCGGYRAIAARDDLAALAEKGVGLDDAAYAQWLDESNGTLDGAGKLFALTSCVSEGRPLSTAEIAAGALRVAEFYTRYSASDTESPAIAMYIRRMFEAVLTEMQKILPDASVRKVPLAPSSATLQ